jgi:hypothetical protein
MASWVEQRLDYHLLHLIPRIHHRIPGKWTMFNVLVSSPLCHISLAMDGLLAPSILTISMMMRVSSLPIMTHPHLKPDHRHLSRTQPNGAIPERQSPIYRPLIFHPLVMCMLNFCLDAQCAYASLRRASYHGRQVNISFSIFHPSLGSLLTRLRVPLFVMKKRRHVQVA